MKPDATRAQLAAVLKTIESRGLKTDVMHGEFQNVIGIIGDEKKIDFQQLASLPGVYDTVRIQVPYRLMSRTYIPNDVVVKVGNVSIGGDNPPV